MLNSIKKIKLSSSILILTILILLLVCSIVLFVEINNYRDIKIQNKNFYYYFSNEKIDFAAEVATNSKQTVISIKNENISFNSSPLYYYDSNNMMLLPSNMEIVYPYKNNPMSKVGEFATISNNNKYIYINSEAGSGRLYDCFLYDGNDLYVFIENTTVVIGEKSYELSPMSFIEVTNGYIRLYNKEKDEYTYLNDYYDDVKAYTEEYFINLLNDTVTYNTSYYMLIKKVDRLDFAKF